MAHHKDTRSNSAARPARFSPFSQPATEKLLDAKALKLLNAKVAGNWPASQAEIDELLIEGIVANSLNSGAAVANSLSK